MLRNTTENSFHPGAYLHELLIWQQISPEEFSDRTGIPTKKIIDITARRRGIDQSVSEELAAYFGNSSRFWLELQESFDRQH